MAFVGSPMIQLPTVLVLGCCMWLVSGLPCSVSRVSGTDGSRDSVAVDCKSLGLTKVPRDIPSDTTELNLQSNKITRVPKNAFSGLRDLVFLDLSTNKIRHLDSGCFKGLTNLRRLRMFNVKVHSFPDDLFRDSLGLEELIISHVGFKSYHATAIRHLTQLRVLAVSPPGDIAVPVDYGRLTNLEILDFRDGELDTIRNDTLDAIRASNISTLSFRDMDRKDHMLTIHDGAFSNFPSLRVINLACNDNTPLKKTIAELGRTVDSSVDTVILDGLGMHLPRMNLFDSADFCKPFWRRVTRLSFRSAQLSGLLLTTDCLRHLRDLNIAYNNLLFFKPPLNYSWLGDNFPELRSIDFSYREISTLRFRERFCYENEGTALLYRAEDHFNKRQRLQTTSYASTNVTIYKRPSSSHTSESVGHTDVGTRRKTLVVTLPPYLESADAVNIMNMAVWACNKQSPIVVFTQNSLRFFNISRNRFATRIESYCLFVGLSFLQVLDMSYGAAEDIDTELFKYYPNLRVLNVSHNALGTSGNSLLGTFTHLTLLEELDISNNRLTAIASEAFSNCGRIKRLKLNNNELDRVDIVVRNMSSLELLDLSGNRLSHLNVAFTTALDALHTKRRFRVDIRRNAFICDCPTVSFVRWVHETPVWLVGRHHVSCSYDGREVALMNITMRHLVDKCSSNEVLSVVLPSVISVVFLGVVVALALQNRWYLQYAFIVCRLKGRRQPTDEGNTYDAIVLYFMHATTTAESSASRTVSRWIAGELLPRAERAWGLRLHIGDRDDVAGPSKVDNFVRAFRSSDAIVVCVTRELVRDVHCIGCLHLALSSAKSLSKYVFVVFDDISAHQLPRRLRHLLAPNSPARRVNWHGNESQQFWGDMRRALLRSSGHAMCGGKQTLAEFDTDTTEV